MSVEKKAHAASGWLMFFVVLAMFVVSVALFIFDVTSLARADDLLLPEPAFSMPLLIFTIVVFAAA